MNSSLTTRVFTILRKSDNMSEEMDITELDVPGIWSLLCLKKENVGCEYWEMRLFGQYQSIGLN